MAIRNIFVDGDPILRKKCRAVEKFDDKLAALLEDMHETLDKSDGLGLAAPQVGMCRRVFVMHLDDNERIEAINPEIVNPKGTQRVKEGCLSCPDVWGYVTRPKSLTLRAQDRNGEWFEMDLEELSAQCASHEAAHLDGQLFIDVVEEYLSEEEMEEDARSQRRRGSVKRRRKIKRD